MEDTYVTIGFFILLGLAAVRDIRTKEVPDRYWLGMAALGLAALFLTSAPGFGERMLGAVCVSLPVLLLTMVIPGAFGGGDIKILCAGGFFLGPAVLLVSMAASVACAGLFVLFRFLIQSKARREPFAFVPFLFLGMVVGRLFHKQIIDWYLESLL